MRSNIVFGLLIALIILLAGVTVMRQREGRRPAGLALPVPTDTASSKASAAGSTAAPSATGHAGAAPKSSAVPAAPPKPKLKRPLRVVGLGWELLAADIMANGGLSTGAKSAYQRLGIEVALAGHTDIAQIENALARGGSDDKGADIALLPLPQFVASYERLKALEPVIFLVASWSDGREVLLSRHTSFAKLPARGTVAMRGAAGTTAAFVGLWALQLAGLPPSRVELVAESDDYDWAALTRQQSKQLSGKDKLTLLLTTGEVSRLVPIVAIAQSSLLASNPLAVTAWAKGRIDGEKLAAEGPTEAARKLGRAKGAPEPLAVLSNMGQLAAASLADSAELAGLSGRGAITLESLFRLNWQIWRAAKVLTVPPEQAPVDGSVIAALVRGGAKLGAPPNSKSASGTQHANPGDEPLIVHRVAKGDEADAHLVDTIGFIAGVFRRSRLRVTAHPKLIVDQKRGAVLIEAARERFGIAADRLVAGKARPKPNTIATIEVMGVE